MKKFMCWVAVLLWISFYAAPTIFAGATVDKTDDDLHSAAFNDDRGGNPWVVNIEEITLANTDFRITKWTGENLQMTLMSIPVDGEIGGEIHHHNDQFIRIESGTARILMGKSAEEITFDEEVSDDWAILIPAGYWHNLLNVGDVELKLYAIYGPPEHPKGTVHMTFQESEEAHRGH